LLGVLGPEVFELCMALSEITFPSDAHLKEIRGFSECWFRSQIEIAASVRISLTAGG
jgi:hypothetical protein